MILYLDASALVKRYIAELGTSDVTTAIAESTVVGTSIISRAETAAALAKAVRTHHARRLASVISPERERRSNVRRNKTR